MENKEEKKKIGFDDILGLAFVGIAAVSLGCAISANVKCHKMEKLLDSSVKKLSDATPVEVADDIVNLAVKKAVDRDVGYAVSNVVRGLKTSIDNTVTTKVSQAVNQNMGKLQKAVTDAIAREAEKIDKSDIMEEATEKAKALLVEKFDGKLDDILDDYNRNLNNISKIYKSIADSMTGGEKK